MRKRTTREVLVFWLFFTGVLFREHAWSNTGDQVRQHSTSAVQPSFPAGRPAIRVFTDKDGLPQNSGMAVAFDRRGYLWVGTQDGAAYSDGRTWTTARLPIHLVSSYVSALASASDGSLWFGTTGGVCVLKDGAWTVHDVKSGRLPGNRVRALLETGGGRRRMWIGTDGGLVCFDGQTRTVYTTANSGLPNNTVRCLSESANGTLWVGTDNGFAALENGAWASFPPERSGLPKGTVDCVLETSLAGRRVLWLGTYPSGLVALQLPASSTALSPPPNLWNRAVFDTRDSPLPSTDVFRLIESKTPDGRPVLWVGTYGGGLAEAELSDVPDLPLSSLPRRWVIHTAENGGLADNFVRCLLETRVSNGRRTLWVGTNNGGLQRMELGLWTTFDTRNSGLPHNTVRAVLETVSPAGHSVLWVGTDGGGVVRLEQGQWTVLNTRNSGLPSDNLRGLLETVSEDGRRIMWFGTSAGVARLDGGTWTLFNDKNGLPDDSVAELAETTVEGRRILWVGTSRGLACLDGNRWTTLTPENSGLPSAQINTLSSATAPDGRSRLWVGTGDRGLARFEDGRWTVFNMTNSALPNNSVMSVMQETRTPTGRSRVWVGTRTGAAWFDPDSPTTAWRTLSTSTRPTLPNNIVSDICRDARNRVYLFTFKGVVRLSPRTDTSDAPDEFNVRTYTTDDGLPGTGVNPDSVLADRQGRIWAGTLYGLAVLDPSEADDDLVSKPLRIERAVVNGQPLAGHPRTTAENDPRTSSELESPGPPDDPPSGIDLAHDENNVVFEYALLSWFRNPDTVYQTQLIGLEREPSPWRTDAKKEYVALPEGDYRFRVRARDYAGNVAGPVEFAFRVRPAPWRTWWAYAFYATVGAGVGSVAYARRTAALKRREDEKSAHFKELQDERFAHLNQLQQERIAHLDQLHEARLAGLRRLLAGIRVVNSQLDLDAVLKKIVEESAELTDAVPGGVGLVENGWVVFKNTWSPDGWTNEEVSFRVGEGVAGHIAALGKPLIVNDTSNSPYIAHPERIARLGVHRLMGTPILSRTGEVAVVLTVYRKEGGPPFTEDDCGLLESLAHQAVVAVENAALYGQLEGKNRELEEKTRLLVTSMKELENVQQQRITELQNLLAGIRVINSRRDLTTVLQTITEESARLIGGEPGGVGLIEGTALCFKCLWNRGTWEDSSVVFQLGRGGAGTAAATAQSVIVNDPEHSPLVAFPELLEKYDVVGFMDVPIIGRDGTVLGVLDIRRPGGRSPFSEADCRLIEALAHQAAVAVENAALYEELERKNLLIVESMHELETLYRQEREVAAKLKELDKMKTDFMTVASHEMRTPLTILRGYSEALSEGYLGDLTEEQAQALDACRRMVDRMTTSFDNILEMLKVHQGNIVLSPMRFDLSLTARNVAAELAGFVEQRRQRLICDLPESLDVTCDPEKIELVVLNLFQNAIKFTPDGGEIRVSAARSSGVVRLTVADTGIGIEPFELERVFERFYAGSDPMSHRSGQFEFSTRGSGLGLAVAKGYVEAHGGRIWAESDGQGKGSRFHVELPAEENDER